VRTDMGGASAPLKPETSIASMLRVIDHLKRPDSGRFLSQNGETIPGGAVIDNSVVVWHPDGTEIMNSSRPAQDGNFCLGVWKRTGKRSYLLNHMPWQGNVFNPAAAPDLVGPPQGGDQIIESVTLSPDGKSYSGTFTLRAYDTFGNVYVWFAGTLSATRITPDTPFTDLL